MIGIFDSGIGGLTVVRALMEYLPAYPMMYFGDTARTPYGSKSRETIIEYAIQDTQFLLSQGAKLIVIACNTASSVATERLIQQFDIPIFEVISPAVELSIQTSKTFSIGVIGTRATINSGIYEKKIKEINPRAKVYSEPCPLLVPLVEEGWLKKPETRMIVKKYLHPLKMKQIDTLILGCTHYPILKPIIQQKIGKRVNVVDSAVAVTGRIKKYLETHPQVEHLMRKNGNSRFFVSDVTSQFEKTAQTLLKRNILLEHVRI